MFVLVIMYSLSFIFHTLILCVNFVTLHAFFAGYSTWLYVIYSVFCQLNSHCVNILYTYVQISLYSLCHMSTICVFFYEKKCFYNSLSLVVPEA